VCLTMKKKTIVEGQMRGGPLDGLGFRAFSEDLIPFMDFKRPAWAWEIGDDEPDLQPVTYCLTLSGDYVFHSYCFLPSSEFRTCREWIVVL